MYSKDSAEVISFLLLTGIREAKDEIYKLKKTQPKKGGYGLISRNDLDIVFSNGSNGYKQEDIDMDEVNKTTGMDIKFQKSPKFGKKNDVDEKVKFARIMWETFNPQNNFKNPKGSKSSKSSKKRGGRRKKKIRKKKK